MVDLANDPRTARILRHFHTASRPTGLICHGPAALLSTVQDGEAWIYRGYRMTVIRKKAEKLAERTLYMKNPQRPFASDQLVPYYVDRVLEHHGAVLDQHPIPFASHVVHDRELITAQNPASIDRVADVFADALEVELDQRRLAQEQSALQPAGGR